MADLRHYCRYCRYWYRCKLQLAYVCTLLHESPMSLMYMSTNCDRRPPSYQNHIFKPPTCTREQKLTRLYPEL